MALLGLIRPGLISLQTKLIGVPIIGFPDVIPLRFFMIIKVSIQIK